jgi:hypothetical protein
MDQNLLRLGRFGFHLTAIDRDVVDPSTLTPLDGDTYIIGVNAVGDWSGLDNQVAVWDNTAQVWVTAVPSVGWIAWVKDEEVLSAYKTTGWSAGVAL